ncbi:6-phosphogluconolactonase/glucosamine-6-phosphate isomerase/deaminase [Breznakia sp. PF5-3]|uniref:glucosamine-6-phosphate deaminase n=1 Tax=unclassified Breznakia TaxID=2623764 RepID=UPI002404F158|nr:MULTISPECIES: glucosamine-6-phosphate deaminase [unclassified Breznakia]MDF9824180.1 6-phosphogluconolactonase/glucosamine-6-phosphate isomerase/deaminase [Breznakia sp. PM6-1]MDF9834978.1 6-phosphogluconolactonase/glucosamine-6-phosphate isomerase/deaminase [Breznakia sp. PF5-3]MDF9837153.1 6-phosphogluconolactonase/glucosamine-6-phosphate isomerase/deaminase [Breznakia sp. PFB2-8]MDF9859143.1 6-phosphogluconolactonase/glucosamine-6-phosphate isomerase/deaminase [Breznakia sp. PH5-24]
MRIIIEKDYEQMSKTVMHLLLAEMYKDKAVHLAITAGSTPKRLYELLSEEIRNKKAFDNVTYYNFDEIPYAKRGGYGVTIENLKKMYFDPAGISMDQVHVLDENNYKSHDDYLANVGGLDAFFMGIGADGHFCGNLPGTTKFGDRTSSVAIDVYPEMYDIIKGEVGGKDEEVPTFYVTMGPRSVMDVKAPVMFASGKGKAAIIKKAFFEPVSENVPSSIFQLHPNFTLVLDEEAASEIKDLY